MIRTTRIALLASSHAIALVVVTACLLTMTSARACGQDCKLMRGTRETASAFYQGWVKNDPFFGAVTMRYLDYAIGGDYYELRADDCPAPILDKTHYRGIELETGWSYVMIRDANAAATAALLPSAKEIVDLTLKDPDRFLPVVLPILQENLMLAGEEHSTEWQQVAELFHGAIKQAHDDTAFRESWFTGLSAEQRKEFGDQPFEYSVAPFVENLKHARDADRNLKALLLLFKLAIVDPGSLSSLTMMTKYPFIIVRRTIGGAAGTEVVVYVDPQPEGTIDPDKCDVYYFYLWSNQVNKLIDVAAFDVLFGIEFMRQRVLGIGQYLRVPLIKKNAAGKTDWFLRNPMPWPQRIDAIVKGAASRPWQAFENGVKPAYRYACELPAMEPHSPLTYPTLGETLRCESK